MKKATGRANSQDEKPNTVLYYALGTKCECGGKNTLQS